MLQTIDYEDGRFTEPCVLLLGYFDGVHIGHRSLFRAAKSYAAANGMKTGVMTFRDPKAGAQVYDFGERCLLFGELGADFVYAAGFSESFRKTEPEQFLTHVAESLSPRAFFCGEDFRFGRDASGDTETLSRFAERREIGVFIQPPVLFGGEKAGATLAKALLTAGEVERLAALLGERYFIRGTVGSEGRHVGRKLGFPTANIHVAPEKYPLRAGVYAVSADISGKTYRGIANYGTRPTFGDERVVLEIYFDGYEGDLYGQELRILFDFFIRPIRRFGSAEELAQQLREDTEKIR